MHDHAMPLGLSDELVEVIGEIRKRVLLDPRRQLAQRLPFGHAVRLSVAFAAQIPEAFIVESDVVFLRDEGARRLRMIEPLAFPLLDVAHARAPFRIWSMWIKRASSFKRSAQPC